MRKYLNLLPIIAFALSSNVMAATLSKVEIRPPFLSALCKTIGSDIPGLVAHSAKKITVTDADDLIKVSQEVQLKVCRLEIDASGSKVLAWKDANPFKGFEAQYFDFSTNSIQEKVLVIDPTSKGNRYDAILSVEEKGIYSRVAVSENTAGEAIGALEIKKLDLLDQNDLDRLDSGAEVKKVVTLSNVLNLTTKVKDQSYQFGDVIYSGQNLALTFKKSNNFYKIKSIK